MGEHVTCPLCGSERQEPGAFCTSCGMQLQAVSTVDTFTTVNPGPGLRHANSSASLAVHHFNEGDTRRIPHDVPHGLYRTTGSFVLRDQFGREVEQSTTEPSDGVFGLLLADDRSSAVAVEIGDGTLTPLALMPVVDVLATGSSEGYCIVGTDIDPGRYWLDDISMAKGGTFHYWGRLDEQLGIIDNEYLENGGGVEITIESTDFAFAYSGTLRPIKASAGIDADQESASSPFRYAQASETSSFTGLLFAGVQGIGAGSTGGLATTWLTRLSDGVVGPCSDVDQVADVLGSFVTGRSTFDSFWTVLNVTTPLGNPGLVLLAQGRGSASEGVSQGTRILVPLVVDADTANHEVDQLHATVDWMLAKMASPYMAYVAPVDSDQDRRAAIQAVVSRAGTRVPGPLSDPEWLADPMVLAVMSNPAGFPGPGSQRLGVLQPRSPGRVDIYAGWQLDLSSAGLLGFALLGHRSVLALIDAVHAVPELRRELGSGTPPIATRELAAAATPSSRASAAPTGLSRPQASSAPTTTSAQVPPSKSQPSPRDATSRPSRRGLLLGGILVGLVLIGIGATLVLRMAGSFIDEVQSAPQPTAYASVPASSDASDVAEALAARADRVERVDVYSRQTDPNGILGDVDGYSSAANLVDRDLSGNNRGIDRGPVVESFGDEQVLTERFSFLVRFNSDAGDRAERIARAGPILFRIPPGIPEDAVTTYLTAFDAVAGELGLPVTLDVSAREALGGDRPEGKAEQQAAIDAVRKTVPELSGVSDKRILRALVFACNLKATLNGENPSIDEVPDIYGQVLDQMKPGPDESLEVDVVGPLVGSAGRHMCPSTVGWLFSGW